MTSGRLAVAVLEEHGLAVTEALWKLDEATTAAWKAAGRADRRRVAACRPHRPWLGCGLSAGVDA
jgi:hypothetical protein